MKKLYRSRTDKVFTGFVGGVAEYFEVDSPLLRLVWLLIVIFTGFFPGILFYVLGTFVVPLKPKSS